MLPGFRQCLIYYQSGKLSTGYSKLQGPRHHTSFSWNLCLPSFPGGSEGKESACNTGDLGSIPELGRSPGKGNGNPLQYSCLENPMDGGSLWATVHGVPKSQIWLSNKHLCVCVCLSTVIRIYSDIRNELVMTTWVLSEFRESWEFCDKDVLKKGSFRSEMSHPHTICPKLVFPLHFFPQIQWVSLLLIMAFLYINSFQTLTSWMKAPFSISGSPDLGGSGLLESSPSI